MADTEKPSNLIVRAKEQLDSLRARSLQLCDRLPLIASHYQRKERVTSRYFGTPRFDSRRRLLSERRSSIIELFYKDFRAFYEDVVEVFRKLDSLLPNGGFEGLLGPTLPSAIPQVRATDRALQFALAKLKLLNLEEGSSVTPPEVPTTVQPSEHEAARPMVDLPRGQSSTPRTDAAGLPPGVRPTAPGRKRGRRPNAAFNRVVLEITREYGDALAEHCDEIARRLDEFRDKDERLYGVTINYEGKDRADIDSVTWTEACLYNPNGFLKFLRDRHRRSHRD